MVDAEAAGSIGASADDTRGQLRTGRAIIHGAMAGWEMMFGAREYEPDGGRDATVGWAFELERDGVRRTINVEVARALAVSDKSAAPGEVRRALTTRGSSAVMAVLDRDTPPRRLVVDRQGIVEIE